MRIYERGNRMNQLKNLVPGQTAEFQILALSLTNGVILDNLLELSMFQLSYLEKTKIKQYLTNNTYVKIK